MIQSFAHRGLKRFYEREDASKIRPDLMAKVATILAHLDAAETPDGMDVPGFGLHRLSGDLKDFWSVKVSRNHRIIFRFNNGHAYDVKLIDYH